MPWLQYFTKSPYENKIDPETGLPERPSMWQTLGHPQDSRDVRRERSAYGQFAATDKPLQANPAYGAAPEEDQNLPFTQADIAKNGMTNPYIRPTAATAFQHPETMRTWQNFQNAPYEAQLKQQEYNQMTPSILGREAENRRNVFQESLDRADPTNELERKKMESQAKTLQDIAHNRTKTVIAVARNKGFVEKLGPPWSNMSDDELAELSGNDPHLRSIVDAVAEGHKIDEGLPALHAHLEATQAKLHQAEAEAEHAQVDKKYGAKASQYDLEKNLADIGNIRASTQLGMRPELEQTEQNQVRQGLFSSKYGVPAANLGSTRELYGVGPQGISATQDPFFSSAQANKWRDAQAVMGQMSGSSLGADVSKAGYQKVAPTLGYGGDTLSTNARLPVGLQEQNPATPSAPQASAPTTLPHGANYVLGETLKRSAYAPIENIKKHGSWIYNKAIKPTVEELDAAREVIRKAVGGTE